MYKSCGLTTKAMCWEQFLKILMKRRHSGRLEYRTRAGWKFQAEGIETIRGKESSLMMLNQFWKVD